MSEKSSSWPCCNLKYSISVLSIFLFLAIIALVVTLAHPRQATGKIGPTFPNKIWIVETSNKTMSMMKVGNEWEFSRDAMWLTKDDNCYLDPTTKQIAEISLAQNIERIWVTRKKYGFVLSRYHGNYLIHSQPAPAYYIQAKVQLYKTWDY